MPYIKQDLRPALDSSIEDLLNMIADTPTSERLGQLNYIISRLVSSVVHNTGPFTSWKYNEIAQVVGTFECAKLEFYRRIAAEKEDKAVVTNGDIPEYEL